MDGDGGSVEICPGRYVVLAVQPWRFPLPLYTNTNCGALSLEWRGAQWTGLYWIWVNITEKNNLKSWKKKLTLILVPWIKLHSDKKERGNKRDWHVSVDIIVTVLQAEISVLRLAKASLLRSFWFYAFFTLTVLRFWDTACRFPFLFCFFYILFCCCLETFSHIFHFGNSKIN